jgi:hypothetical protein
MYYWTVVCITNTSDIIEICGKDKKEVEEEKINGTCL